MMAAAILKLPFTTSFRTSKSGQSANSTKEISVWMRLGKTWCSSFQSTSTKSYFSLQARLRRGQKSKSAALPINSISRFLSCVGRDFPTSWKPSLHWSMNTLEKAEIPSCSAPRNLPFTALSLNLRVTQFSRFMRVNRPF